jgi:hypothetical protein
LLDIGSNPIREIRIFAGHGHNKRKAREGFKKKLAQMMGMQAKAIDPYVKKKGGGARCVWGFVTNFQTIAL